MQEDLQALDRFLATLDWLLAIHECNPDAMPFGLIHVCFHDKQQLGARYGARDAVQMLNNLARQLRSSFRRTDLVARDGTDFWILVPFTEPDTVTRKVATLVELASDNGLDIVDRDVAVFALPDAALLENMTFTSVEDFLVHLKMNRQIALRWEHVVQLPT